MVTLLLDSALHRGASTTTAQTGVGLMGLAKELRGRCEEVGASQGPAAPKVKLWWRLRPSQIKHCKPEAHAANVGETGLLKTTFWKEGGYRHHCTVVSVTCLPP